MKDFYLEGATRIAELIIGKARELKATDGAVPP